MRKALIIISLLFTPISAKAENSDLKNMCENFRTIGKTIMEYRLMGIDIGETSATFLRLGFESGAPAIVQDLTQSMVNEAYLRDNTSPYYFGKEAEKACMVAFSAEFGVPLEFEDTSEQAQNYEIGIP